MTITTFTVNTTDSSEQAKIFETCEEWGLEPSFNEESEKLYFESYEDADDVRDELKDISSQCEVTFFDMVTESAEVK